MSDVINFDLHIIDAGSHYLISAAAPGVVGDLSPRPLLLPFDPAELPRRRRDAVEWVEQARVRTLAGEESFKRARERGEALFNHLFAGEIGAAYRVARSRLAP
ncbi:MAG: hypothetical protein RMJ54_19505, partial [Roseiflexaceae bacterium]|nr:hypothetical protein [Roseiflexaceae bacterium]